MAEKRITIDQYRKTIRGAWSPLVGRQKFTSFEYALTAEWYGAHIPVQWITDAISLVARRNVTVYSLGVIKPDLERIKAQRQRLAQAVKSTKPPDAGQQQKAEFSEYLITLADSVTDPECGAMIKELFGDLAGLTLDQAYARFGEIHRCLERGRQ